jgi:DNA polymerase-3 subunit delta
MATFDEISRDLKNKIYQPVYLLHGEEPYFVDQLTEQFEKILEEGQREFNQHILYAKEIEALSLLDVVRRYPMMSEYQVVILKEAQHLKEPELLIPYLENPLSSTIFVMAYKNKKLDKRTKFAKIAQSKGVLFESKALYDNQVPAWINGFMKTKGYQISPHASTLLTDYLGTDLAKIANELNKLLLNVQAGSHIDVTHVEKNIGISKDYNMFEFSAALGMRDIKKANQIMDYFIANPKSNPLVMLLGGMYRYFSRLYLCYLHPHASDRELASLTGIPPFAIKDNRAAMRNYSKQDVEAIVNLLHEYDLRSKGVNNANTASGELLKEMTWRILHVGQVEVV